MFVGLQQARQAKSPRQRTYRTKAEKEEWDSEEKQHQVHRTGSVVIGIFTPLVATLALPGLTERYYVLQRDGYIVDSQRDPPSTEALGAVGLAAAFLAAFCVLLRTLETHFRFCTFTAMISLAVNLITTLAGIALFSAKHRRLDNFNLSSAFFLSAAGAIVSACVLGMLVVDCFWGGTDRFRRGGTGLSGKQRSLVISFSAFQALWCIASLINKALGDLTFLNALYFTLSSFTAAFGDIRPEGDVARGVSLLLNTAGIVGFSVLIAFTRVTMLELAKNVYKGQEKKVIRWWKDWRRKSKEKAEPAETSATAGTTEEAEEDKEGSKRDMERESADEAKNGGAEATGEDDKEEGQEDRKNAAAEGGKKGQKLEGEKEEHEKKGQGKKGKGSKVGRTEQSGGGEGAETGTEQQEAKGDNEAVGDDEDDQEEELCHKHYEAAILELNAEKSLDFRSEIIVSFLIFIVVWLVGSAVYMKLEGWTFFTAFYFVYSGTAVAYGDLYPSTMAGRSFYIVFTSAASITLTVFFSVLAEAYSSRFQRTYHRSAVSRAMLWICKDSSLKERVNDDREMAKKFKTGDYENGEGEPVEDDPGEDGNDDPASDGKGKRSPKSDSDTSSVHTEVTQLEAKRKKEKELAESLVILVEDAATQIQELVKSDARGGGRAIDAIVRQLMDDQEFDHKTKETVMVDPDLKRFLYLRQLRDRFTRLSKLAKATVAEIERMGDEGSSETGEGAGEDKNAADKLKDQVKEDHQDVEDAQGDSEEEDPPSENSAEEETKTSSDEKGKKKN